jgi:hypothetical protein
MIVFVVRYNGTEAQFATVQERDTFADNLRDLTGFEPVRGFIVN